MTDHYDAQNLLEALARATRYEANNFLNAALCRAVRLTKSPIVALFLAAFDVSNYIAAYTDPQIKVTISSTWDESVGVVPQFKWGFYCIDFALFSGSPEPVLFVECDGHNYHERTADQAEHDRKRDRAVQEAGITVFRFTGRELYRDAGACVEQVVKFMGQRSQPK